MKLTTWTLAVVLLAAVPGCAGTETRRSTGEQVDDTVLLSRVKTALVTNEDTDGLDIDVEVFRGRVQLNGVAENEARKEAATRVAEAVTGVVEVQNNLTVQQESRRVGEYVDDKSLEARVKTALARAEGVNALDVEVEANRGVVALGGFVDSEDEKQRAGEVVAGVRYVERVVNDIAVR
ncbi:MAG: BON domain-containing protein [Pseudomonadota bacterium]